jgi:hypothetical protein
MPLVAPETVILLVYMVAGGALVLLGLPLYFRKIPPNRFYGFRTERTLLNPDVWYAVNRVTGGWLVITGAIAAGVATWAQRSGYDAPTAAGIDLISFVMGMGLMLVHSLRTLWRLT